MLSWQNKLVALWVFSILNFIAVLLIPGSMEAIVSQVGDATGMLVTLYFFVTCVMIWITLVLSPNAIRWPTIVVGAYFAFVKIQWIISAITADLEPALFLNEVWGLLVALMIMWFGWKTPAAEKTD